MKQEELEKWKKAAQPILEDYAARGKSILFDELCEKLQTTREAGILTLGPALGSFSKEGSEQGLMISVVVVDSDGLPWKGFFRYAQKLMEEGESNEGFFNRHFEEVCRVYGARQEES